MFKDFITEKIFREVKFLEQLRYQNIVPVNEFSATEEPDDFTYPGFLSPCKTSGKMGPGEFWSGRDRYIWLHTEFSAPKEWKGKDVLGVFNFGITGGGYNSGFEALLFLNRLPYQGIDSNHTEVFFTAQPGKAQEFDFRLWSGLEGGGPKHAMDHKISQAFFCTLEPSVDELYYLILNMVPAIKELPDDDPSKSVLQNILAEGYKFIDFTNPGSEAFITSVRKALEYYNRALKSAKTQKDVSVSFIGHTHIDLSWLWRYKHTREKGERSFETVLRLMERYPEYVFLQTQAQLYESIKADNPKLYGEIAKRIAEKRWEASGAMWVEADCNIPSGESLVRQILYGKRFFKKEFGVDNNFLWLPDVFGYNWAMPQILKKSGIDTFITTKISWSEINRMPHDTFNWTGMDGTTVLTHFITTPSGGSWFYTYNGMINPGSVRGIWSTYRDKALNRDLLFSYGYGDGGGGVTRGMLESLRAIAKLPGFPAVKTERVDEYLGRLHKTITAADKPGSASSRLLHNFDRELYLEFHRGTYTSQAYTKKMNRRLELLYRNAEILQCLPAVASKKWDQKTWDNLEAGWKLILLAQFHDIIPGSSIGEVYEDTRADHLKAMALGQKAFNNALNSLVRKDNDSYTLINTAAWKRSGIAALPAPDRDKIYADDNGPCITQVSGSDKKKAYVYAAGINPLAASVIRQEDFKNYIQKNQDGQANQTSQAKTGHKPKFSILKNGVDSPFYKIRWDAKGRLSSIWDKQTGREVLNGPGNEIQIFEDRPKTNDAWEIEATIDLKKEIFGSLDSVSIEETGPLFVRVRFTRTYNKSKMTQDMIVYSVHKRIDFKTTVDWQERSKLLKAAFPVDIRSVTARYEIQYGSLERTATRSTSWDEAQFEAVGHQWADYSETGFGIALMNDCKYGYDIKEGVMRLSLLKSAEKPDTEADRGLHEFTYSLYVHSEPWYDCDLIPLAWDLNDPIIAIPGKPVWTGEPIKINATGAALDAVKKSEDGTDVILRFHEMHGGRSQLKIEFEIPIAGWAEANLMEEPIETFQKQNMIIKELHPFEIVTFRVKL
ncbi:MAG: alpha-mannosidase [Treponema sp.]|nr:alpha-mannosidase [Treponema sp.]